MVLRYEMEHVSHGKAKLKYNIFATLLFIKMP